MVLFYVTLLAENNMQLEPVEKHLQKIQRKREDLFIQSLGLANNYYNNSRNYYLVILFLSVIIILADLSLFFTFELDTFIKTSLVFALTSFLFSLAIYLNFLEKGSEKMGDIVTSLDLKYKQEINILRSFYAGRVNSCDVRNFYLNSGTFIDKKYFGSTQEFILRWINFILLSLAMVMLLLNFM